MHRSQQLAVMFLLGAFVVGGTLGFTVDRVLGERGAHDYSRAAFAAELSLSAAQRAAVDSILDERHRVIDSLVAPVRPGIQAAHETARRQITARLNDAQRAKFEAFIERKRKEAAKDSADRH